MTWNAALPASIASRPSFSCATDSDGSEAGDDATRCMIVAACRAASPWLTSTSPFSETSWPPALVSSVLNQTEMPSYWAACTSMYDGSPRACSASDWRIMSSHVAGGVGARSVRYQRSWVLVLSGAAHSRPW
ncbi:hypothetical protein BJF78_23910 [Pseudonocardia sp. CNS-139]|nr:hypothetical protein BJF78_23910 [Pseudonocardia sp. CNS-139]